MRHFPILPLLFFSLLAASPGYAQIGWDPDATPEAANSTAERGEMVWASAEPPPRIAPWGQGFFLLYRNTWSTTLTEMTRYFSLDADGDEPSHDWEDHCDRVLVGLVDLLAQLQDAAPGDGGLPQEIATWVADETEAVNQLCEHGGTAAIVFYQLEEETQWLDESIDHATSSWNRMMEWMESLTDGIEELDDELSKVEALVSKATLKRTLTDEERQTLSWFREAGGYGSIMYPSTRAIIENLAESGLRRDSAYTNYLSYLEEREDVFDDLIAQLPASLEGSRGTSSLYEKYVKEVLIRREAFSDSLDDLEEITLPLRTGEFDAGTSLPLGIRTFDDFNERVDNISRRIDAVMEKIPELLS